MNHFEEVCSQMYCPIRKQGVLSLLSFSALCFQMFPFALLAHGVLELSTTVFQGTQGC
jgi:hypothetical protein